MYYNIDLCLTIWKTQKLDVETRIVKHNCYNIGHINSHGWELIEIFEYNSQLCKFVKLVPFSERFKEKVKRGRGGLLKFFK